jgi:hypothetical protein
MADDDDDEEIVDVMDNNDGRPTFIIDMRRPSIIQLARLQPRGPASRASAVLASRFLLLLWIEISDNFDGEALWWRVSALKSSHRQRGRIGSI